MLTDRPRQEAYRDAILSNSSLFVGKTVLDVGAGTGILSIFCAQAGAAKVYAIEASRIADLARETVKENGFDNIIEVHQTKIEDFTFNEEDQRQVDIIVSEWMGFYLLHEGMLDSVLYARDKFLKPTGSMFPQNASINLGINKLTLSFESILTNLYSIYMQLHVLFQVYLTPGIHMMAFKCWHSVQHFELKNH